MSRLLLGIALACIFLTNIVLAFSWWPVNAAAPEPALASAAAQTETHFVRQVPVVAKDVVFDPVGGKIYASVPSRAGAAGNSIARINPVSGAVEGFVFVGSEPGKLALADDGQTLYVSLDGAGAVRRYNLVTQTAGAQFSVGDGGLSTGPLFVKDIAIAPGNPNLVAISRKKINISPDFEGVAVYDNGVRRPVTTPGHTGSDFIDFSTSASTLYGFSSCCAGLQKMSVTASGVTVVSSTSSTVFGGDFKFEDGFIYLQGGQVWNPETAAVLGTFPVSFGGIVEPDSVVDRVYFLTGADQFADDTTIQTVMLRAFDQNTFLPLGTLELPNVRGQVRNLIRWGANGLAFGTTGGQVFLIQTTLVPSNDPVPTPTPTPLPTSTPTPTPTPTPAPGELTEVSLVANDIVIDPTSETIYASVPSSVGAGGNSITPINPFTGTVGTPVFVGSEPNKMAISDNNQLIYVGLDGAKAVRRFDVASSTPGLQFSLGSNQQGQFGAVDIAVVPGQPQSVAIVRGNHPNDASGGVALYDDGVQRPITTGVFHTINVIEYSASPSILYGHNNFSSEFGFRKMAAVSCGVSVISATSLLQGTNFKIEDGLAYATSGRVADPEKGTLVGTYPVFEGAFIGPIPTAVLADSESNRVFFFLPQGNNLVLVRAYDLQKFLHVGTLALPNIDGLPTSVVRWGTNGFAFRTTTGKVYRLQTSLIAPPMQPPPAPAPTPTPPTYTLRGQVANASFNAPPLPTVTLQLSGGQTASTTTNADGSFSFAGLPFCTDFTVTPAPLENYNFSPTNRTITPADQNSPNQANAFFNAIPKMVGFLQSGINVDESFGSINISVTRSGNLVDPATVMYETVDGTASDRSDYIAAIGTLRFGPNEASKLITLFVTDDVRDETNETLTLTLSSPTGALLSTLSTLTVTINDNDATDGTSNPVDDPTFFVRQHYRDFLNRDPARGRPRFLGKRDHLLRRRRPAVHRDQADQCFGRVLPIHRAPGDRLPCISYVQGGLWRCNFAKRTRDCAYHSVKRVPAGCTEDGPRLQSRHWRLGNATGVK